MERDMAGKTVVFSGGTRGMGLFAAQGLAARGADVVLIGHDAARGAEALAKVREAGSQRAELVIADLSRKSEVERAARRVLELRPTVHVLINNAAAMLPEGARTEEGVDQSFALNFLAAYGLTRRLEGALAAANGARVVNVTSLGHRMVKKVDLDALMHPGAVVSQFDSYGIAKLAMVTFAYGLSRRLANAKVTANILDPFMVETDIGEGFGGNAFQRWVMFKVLPSLLGTTREKGALPYLHLACAPELDGVTGAYFVKTKQKDSSALAHDEVLGRRIEDASEAWLSGAQPARSTAQAMG